MKKSSDENYNKIYLIGCGPGSLKHLTIEAYELIPTLDVALVDGLVGKEILSLLKTNCKVVNVAKEKGLHSASQEEINDLIVSYARDSGVVGRLKGGDTTVFARTAEEASYIIERGFDVEIVAGISSSLMACSSSGIFPTIRGISSSFSVVSAHLRDCMFNRDWIDMLKIPKHTTIVLMGHSFAGEIRRAAIDVGADLSIPAAYVSNIDSPHQKSVIGILDQLEIMADSCDKPAVLIIGNSVGANLNIPCFGEKLVL